MGVTCMLNEKNIILEDIAVRLEDEFKQDNLVIAEKREIQYGIQLHIMDTTIGEGIVLNIYKGKSGISYVANNKASSLYKRVFEKINSGLIDLKYKSEVKNHAFENYIGTDESGKGDYFGPLVVGGFLMEKGMQKELDELGVRDCKKVSDDMVLEIYQLLKRQYSNNLAVFSLIPVKYNEMYSQFKFQRKNLNHLLAWGHAMVIEKLMERNKLPEGIVSDQFGNSLYLQNSMYEKGRNVQLIQNTGAEKDSGVAAASIIARGEFLLWLKKTSEEYGMIIPKGASETALKVASDISNKMGVEELKKIVKLHFKSTKTVLYCRNSY
jgi:ribonuclease HIII